MEPLFQTCLSVFQGRIEHSPLHRFHAKEGLSSRDRRAHLQNEPTLALLGDRGEHGQPRRDKSFDRPLLGFESCSHERGRADKLWFVPRRFRRLHLAQHPRQLQALLKLRAGGLEAPGENSVVPVDVILPLGNGFQGVGNGGAQDAILMPPSTLLRLAQPHGIVGVFSSFASVGGDDDLPAREPRRESRRHDWHVARPETADCARRVADKALYRCRSGHALAEDDRSVLFGACPGFPVPGLFNAKVALAPFAVSLEAVDHFHADKLIRFRVPHGNDQLPAAGDLLVRLRYIGAAKGKYPQIKARCIDLLGLQVFMALHVFLRRHLPHGTGRLDLFPLRRCGFGVLFFPRGRSPAARVFRRGNAQTAGKFCQRAAFVGTQIVPATFFKANRKGRIVLFPQRRAHEQLVVASP